MKPGFRTKGLGQCIHPRDLWRGEEPGGEQKVSPTLSLWALGIDQQEEEKQKQTWRTTYAVIPFIGCSGACKTPL